VSGPRQNSFDRKQGPGYTPKPPPARSVRGSGANVLSHIQPRTRVFGITRFRYLWHQASSWQSSSIPQTPKHARLMIPQNRDAGTREQSAPCPPMRDLCHSTGRSCWLQSGHRTATQSSLRAPGIANVPNQPRAGSSRRHVSGGALHPSQKGTAAGCRSLHLLDSAFAFQIGYHELLSCSRLHSSQ
jgi:hypothetical protein